MHQPDPPTIVLVHGTWARGAEWTQVGSPIHRCLTDELGVGTTTRQFEWSGRNDHHSRVSAAGELGDFLSELLKEKKGGPVVIVAHSHGGNVMRHALGRDEVKRYRDIAGIALGTPFISIEPREILGVRDYLDGMGNVGTIVAFVAIVVLAAWGVIAFSARFQLPSLLCAALVGISTLAGSGFLYFAFQKADRCRAIVDSVFGNLQEYIETRHRQLRAEDVGRTPMLHLTTREDEAHAYLTSLAFASSIPFRAWNLFVRSQERFVRVMAFAFFGAIACMLVLLTGDGAPIGKSWTDGYIGTGLIWLAVGGLALVFAVYGLMLLAPPLLWVVMAILPRVVRATRFGFGGEGVFDNLFLRIDASNQPGDVDDFELRYLTLSPLAGANLPKGWIEGRVAQLRHCRLYREQQTFDEIVQWLRHRGISKASGGERAPSGDS